MKCQIGSRARLKKGEYESRAPRLAALADTILNGTNRTETQTALETLAEEIINPLEQIEYQSEKQTLER